MHTSAIFLTKAWAQSAQIDSNRLYQHIEYLSNDALEGRGTGYAGGKKASDYLAQFMKLNSILPAAKSSSYFQNVPMHGSKVSDSTCLHIDSGAKQTELLVYRDFLIYRSGPELFSPAQYPVVFVGYGIIAPEYDYNDYQQVDVDGKIVVMLSGEPYSQDVNFFNGAATTIYSSPESKQRIAISRGAAGSIIIPNPRDKRLQDWPTLRREFAFEDVRLAYSVNTHISVLMHSDAAAGLFEQSEYDLKQIYEMDRKSAVQSFALPVKVCFNGKLLTRDFFARNVIGYIPGQRDDYVLLSAHYDHLGIGPAVLQDSIYNGMSDNATGVAALLELSRILAMQRDKYTNSILIIFTTGEEKGLLGSQFYCDHPVVPLYKTMANVNIDGLAIFDQFNEVIGIGAELSDLERDLNVVSEQFGLNIGKIPPQYFEESLTLNRSDQFSFAKVGIPSILILEGLDYKTLSYDEGLSRIIEWNTKIYHTPFDDVSQEIDMAAAVQHSNFLLAFVEHLAQRKDPVNWKPGVPFITARLRTIAERR